MAVKTSLVVFTSTSVIVQFLNCLISPRTFLAVTVLFSVLTWITSLKRIFPLRIMLNSHMLVPLVLVVWGLLGVLGMVG
jgi:hypothetical protein